MTTEEEEKTMKITKSKIKQLEKELENEKTNMKRRVFLKATINIYSEKLGLKKPYSDYGE